MLCKLLVLVFYRPYDTLEEVIGIRGTPGQGSLKEWNVAYRELPLAPGGLIDWAELCTAIRPGEDSQYVVTKQGTGCWYCQAAAYVGRWLSHCLG